MSRFLTPDVYTEEVPLLPQSVAEVSTAVPAFIGYTEKAVKNGKNIRNTAVRVSTLLEFKEAFGGAQPASFKVSITEDDVIGDIEVTTPLHTLYHAIDLYFKNGGGDCYVISVGSYQDDYSKTSFLAGLEALSKEDEPTLIMLGEAIRLDAVDYHEVCQSALAQCQELKDRFCIFDIQKDDEEGTSFRNGIGTNNLKYGAAYTPYLQTSLTYRYQEDLVEVSGSSANETLQLEIAGAIRVVYNGSAQDTPKVKINKGSGNVPSLSVSDTTLTINVGDGTPASEIIDEWNATTNKGDFDIILLNGATIVESSTGTSDLITTGGDNASVSLSTFKESRSELYSRIISEISKQRIILPPSAAVAGAYATTDRERGVWKAPANVSLNAVIGPISKITSKDQEKLNVDATSGKSINAIRSFVGKGTMVWGARTLAGNDNEWRYVPVRRLFNMIEESTKKASQFAVFESNDAVTWLKVKAMIESFLYGVWQQGGLAGATEEQAYFVNIGLGKTMTQQDILEGKMIVEIGLAAVRPAEFIVLKFSHKLQES
ncbi:phage tail sheath C-terminal domain-containing protein [Aquimarina gracilis]|uniref:Phage tail sheath C-terminal domain-containing protein n=1 Tax=Aquimarina gracilis TaxID=874422 RepID=A0ABU5ZQ55_9FLAO|nr:phage tail sheath C-terminal domain-containing protein [Aquimarina gracilis]MEB3344059.1 phage tail sheath C-terminal domain-containing protein [Aquimarina gracilis]